MCRETRDRQGAVAALVEERARIAPSRLAYAAGRDGRQLGYGELGRLAAEWSVRLRSAGLGRGRRVGLQADAPLVFASTYLGLLAAGVTVVPLDPRLPPAEAGRHLDRVGADLLITDRPGASPDATPVWWVDPRCQRVVGASGRCRPRLPDEEDPPAVVLLSSGTTGEPKVVPLGEAQVLHVARLIARHHRLGPADRGYSPLPLFHVNAQVVGLLATLVSGGSLVLDGRFHRTGCWELARAWRVTWLNLVPAILAILAAGEPPPGDVARRVRFARTASAPLPGSTQRSFEERCGISVLETYGMSEAASQITANPLRRRRRRQGSAGIPVGVRLRVVDAERRSCPAGEVGSVEIRGPSVIRHYLAPGGPDAPGHRAARQADGWLVTGDLGRLDADGFLHLTGRSDDVINRGGEKVYPREVEEVLRTESQVSDVVVAGRSDPVLGQCPVAYVVARDGADPAALARRLRALAAASLSPSRRPVRLVVVDALPAGATGKVSRRRLAAWEPGHVRVRLELEEGRAS